jgi:hypothetical protein
MKDYPMGHYIIYIISLIFYVTKTFYSICYMIIKEILFVKMHRKEKTIYIIQGIKFVYNYYPSGILYQRNVILSF